MESDGDRTCVVSFDCVPHVQEMSIATFLANLYCIEPDARSDCLYNVQEMSIATSKLIVYNLQEMSIATFLANLGGMLGFCMGLSLVGVVEIVYHIIVSPLIQLAQFMYK